MTADQSPVSELECAICFTEEDGQPKVCDFSVFSCTRPWNQEKEDACVITAMNLLRKQWLITPYRRSTDVSRVYLRGTLQLFVLPTRDDAPEYRLTISDSRFFKSEEQDND